jgi:hypothetical protein
MTERVSDAQPLADVIDMLPVDLPARHEISALLTSCLATDPAARPSAALCLHSLRTPVTRYEVLVTVMLARERLASTAAADDGGTHSPSSLAAALVTLPSALLEMVANAVVALGCGSVSPLPFLMRAVGNKRSGHTLTYAVLEVRRCIRPPAPAGTTRDRCAGLLRSAHAGGCAGAACQVPTPTIVSELDIIVRIEAAPINPSDLHAVGMTTRLGQVRRGTAHRCLDGSTESPPSTGADAGGAGARLHAGRCARIE